MDIYSEDELKRVRESAKNWEATSLKADLEKKEESKSEFKTSSGIPVHGLYTPLDQKEGQWSYLEKLGFPGEYPFTRGITPTMYRTVPPRLYSYSGYGSAEATNERYKYLLAQGAREISIASHLPAQIGYDSDNPLAKGEVAKIGCAIDSLADVETIFSGISMEQLSIGVQANATSPIHLAFILAAAEKQGLAPHQIRVTIQNDILKEYFAEGTYIFPPRAAVKISCDLVEYAVRNNLSNSMIPMYYTGYHTREAGGNAVQEMAFTLADAVSYIEEILSRGIAIDEFPGQMVLFSAGLDLFEEISKYRAFRRMWARLMKERFKAKNPRVLGLIYRNGSQSALYTAQQPMNNIVRGAIAALVEVLSGTQIINIAAWDEALSIPTEESATLVLRTMQVITEETGILNTVDPLAGSYYVEALTDQLEERATKLFEQLETLGGAVACIESGFQEREIARHAYEQLKQVERGERTVVGVNKYRMDETVSFNLSKADPEEEARQIEKVRRLRKERDNKKVEIALKDLKGAATGGVNLVPAVLTAAKAYATIGEMCDVLREVYGVYKSPVY